MKLMKCMNNHFYDGDLYASCPHCKKTSGDPRTEKIDRAKKREERNGSGSTGVLYENDYYEKTEESQNDLKKEIDDINVTERIQPNIRENVRLVNGSPTILPFEETNEEIYVPVSSEPRRHEIPDDDERTVKFASREGAARDPLVGWLVGLNGEVYGEGFPLVAGKNYIGRGVDMDVMLHGDLSISRNKHAVIIYDPKNRQFLLQPGESKKLFYMDDKVVLDTQVMKDGCELCIGETRLKFVAFCGENFSWET